MSPRVSRPSKRHLIRWNEALDKKLLLCIQVACNQDGTKIPWDRVGALMDDNNTGGAITDGAIVQHLAKLRQRMVNENLPVPPPLRRGGTARISTTSNAGIRSVRSTIAGSPVIPVSAARRQPNTAQCNSPATIFSTRTPGKISKNKNKRKSKKSRQSMSDEDLNSDEEEDFDDESDGEYGRPITRRAKASGQGRGKGQPKSVVIEQSSEEEAISGSSNSGDKRECGATKTIAFDSETKIDDESDKEGGGKTVSANGERYVGNNASFLPVESITSSRSCSYAEESLIVSINWGKAFRGESASYQMAHMKLIDRGVLPQLPVEEDYNDEEEDEEEQDSSLTETGGSFHVDTAGKNINHFNMFGYSDGPTTNGLPHLSNDRPADCLTINHDEYLQSELVENLQQNHLGLPSDLGAEQHGHFDQLSFENIVQTPIDMEFPQAAHTFDIHTNLDSSMLNFDDDGAGALHNPSQTHYAYGAFHMPTHNHGHGHTRYLSDTTNNQSGQSMSSAGSGVAIFPSNTSTAPHHNQHLFGAFPSASSNGNDLPDHNDSNFDATLEDPNLKLEGFAFGPNGYE